MLLSLSVAAHCMTAYAVPLGDLRVAVHAVAGCFVPRVRGQVLVVRSRRLPGWALPLASGLLVTLIAVVSYSSSLWYFDTPAGPCLTWSDARPRVPPALTPAVRIPA